MWETYESSLAYRQFNNFAKYEAVFCSMLMTVKEWYNGCKPEFDSGND